MNALEVECNWCGNKHLYQDSYITTRTTIVRNFKPLSGNLESSHDNKETLHFDKHSCRNSFLYGM